MFSLAKSDCRALFFYRTRLKMLRSAVDTEIAGQFKRGMSLVKVRESAHSKDIRSFDIVDDVIEIGPLS